MIHSISRPELLNIAEGEKIWFGGRQDWYSDPWRRMSGCGPTCCANVFAYLAASLPELRPLFSENSMSVEPFTVELNAAFEHVRPGAGGLNRPEVFARGAAKLAESRGVELIPRLFVTVGCRAPERPDFSELAAFVSRGLDADCPVAFLCLASGREKRLQDWHWITLASFDDAPGESLAWASDEGRRVSFDLGLWYQTTPMRGGLVWFERGGVT